MARNMENPYHITLQRVMLAMSASNLGELAIKLDAPENTVRNWHKRNSVPFEWIKQVAKSSGRTIEWFTEEGEKNLSQQVKELTKLHAPGNLPYPKIQPAEPLIASDNISPYGAAPVAVPVFAGIKASAGNGSGMQSNEPTEVHMLFSPVYMRRHFGRSGEGFAMIYVKGDSMQPGLLDGDEIVIDTRHKRVDRDGIYVITLRGDLKVKRIQQRLDGSLVVKSDNPAYEAECIAAAQAEEFMVEGRLVWPRLR